MPDFDAGDPCEITFDRTKGNREELCPNGCGERLRLDAHAWEVDHSGEWHSHERCIARLKALVQCATAFEFNGPGGYWWVKPLNEHGVWTIGLPGWSGGERFSWAGAIAEARRLAAKSPKPPAV
jgi:hypothetical protein